MKFLLFILILFILAMTFLLASGCEVLKGKRSTATDSVTTHRVDTVHLVTTQVSNKQDSTWWKEIWSFMPRGGDTTMIRTTVPINNYYPTQVVREGGSISQEWLTRVVDSLAKSHQDSTKVLSATTEKSKETKVLTQWYIWVIGGLVLLCGILIASRFFKLK